MQDCIFCQLPPQAIVEEQGTMVVIRDKHPVSRGHHLILPKVHREDYFTLTNEERDDLHCLLVKLKERLMAEDRMIAGFNIGINCGKAAGQSIMHAHVHLIPRRRKDVAAPKGGVRGVIPNKQGY